MSTLYYIHDPMCSWCYAFKPVYQALLKQLPDSVSSVSLLGGLAPDTDQPMPLDMQQQLKATWQRIEQQVPGIRFNYDFWELAEQTRPRRATYPACRAVIAARQINPGKETAMIETIQNAYYQQARNPSDPDTLTALAQETGLKADEFSRHLNAAETQHILDQEITLCRQLNVHSYPSLVLQTHNQAVSVSIDYNSHRNILNTINSILNCA